MDQLTAVVFFIALAVAGVMLLIVGLWPRKSGNSNDNGNGGNGEG
jgi:hypothetical protein